MNVFDYFFENSKDINKDFLLGSKEQISYNELFDKSLQIAAYLIKETKKDEKILLLSHNNIFFLTVYLGILKSGRICVPLNPDIEAENLEYITNECSAKYLFVDSGLLNKYDVSRYKILSNEDIADLNKYSYLEEDGNFNSEDCAEIIFTSGSTGEPKGVMISHKNLIANTGSIIEYLNLNSDDIMEVVLPFYYCYGLSLLHTHLRVGGSIVLNNTFIFLGSVMNDLKKYKCTGFAGVPSHFQILLRKSESFKKDTFPHLRYVTQAGGKLHTIFIKEFLEAHPEINFYVMYGQTEATARLSYLPLEYLESKMGSIGKGIPRVELKVVNQSGKPVKPGETGEIIARGDNIMMGYLNDPESTNQTIRDLWLYTGDLGTTDKDGFIYLTARQKEIIKVGGKRVSPKEIEETIVSIPEVIDCTVFAIEDALLGEAIKANIIIDKVNRDSITPDTIKEYCAQKLASYKIPQVIEIKEQLNIASTGKKLKSRTR